MGIVLAILLELDLYLGPGFVVKRRFRRELRQEEFLGANHGGCVADFQPKSERYPAAAPGNGSRIAFHLEALARYNVSDHSLDPAVSRQLKQIGIDHDKTVQELVAEAINGLFQKYGKPPIS
jgi:hypothetical protein